MRAALLLMATAALAPGARAATPGEVTLLERHRPVLRYDSGERRFAVSVEALTAVSEVDRERGTRRRVPSARFLGARYGDGPRAHRSDRLVPVRHPRRGRPLVYGRAARDGRGRLWLQ